MKVDIIMPIYNPTRYTIKALESCFAQSYKNIRVTVIDDCSDKDVLFLKKRYPKINLLKTPTNLGPAGARNYGIANTDADLISFLDDDDIMHKDKLLYSVKALKADQNIGMTCGNYRILVNGRLRSPFYKKNIYIDHSKLMRQNLVASGSVTIRRDVFNEVEGFDERFRIAEDYSCWIKVSEKYSIKYLHQVLYIYRIQPGGNSLTQRSDIQENHLKNLEIIKRESKARIDATKKRLGK